MDVGIVVMAVTLVALLVLLAWLVADLHPDDQRRLRPWFLMFGSGILVFAVLVAVRIAQVGL